MTAYKKDSCIKKLYRKKIIPFISTPVIKVISGMRRAGKSCLMKLIMDELTERKVDSGRIVYINKESFGYDFIRNYKSPHSFIKKKFKPVRGQKYLFVDEIHEIYSWEKAITSFVSQGDIDIYLSGSNAGLLSSEIATFLSDRYIEISVYPLGFDEFLMFRKSGGENLYVNFSDYLKFGGLPALHYFPMNETVVWQYISSVYDTIVLRDVIRRNNIRNVRLLEDITVIFSTMSEIFFHPKKFLIFWAVDQTG